MGELPLPLLPLLDALVPELPLPDVPLPELPLLLLPEFPLLDVPLPEDPLPDELLPEDPLPEFPLLDVPPLEPEDPVPELPFPLLAVFASAETPGLALPHPIRYAGTDRTAKFARTITKTFFFNIINLSLWAGCVQNGKSRLRVGTPALR